MVRKLMLFFQNILMDFHIALAWYSTLINIMCNSIHEHFHEERGAYYRHTKWTARLCLISHYTILTYGYVVYGGAQLLTQEFGCTTQLFSLGVWATWHRTNTGFLQLNTMQLVTPGVNHCWQLCMADVNDAHN